MAFYWIREIGYQGKKYAAGRLEKRRGREGVKMSVTLGAFNDITN